MNNASAIYVENVIHKLHCDVGPASSIVSWSAYKTANVVARSLTENDTYIYGIPFE